MEPRITITLECRLLGEFLDDASTFPEVQKNGNVGNSTAPVMRPQECRLLGDFIEEGEESETALSSPVGKKIEPPETDTKK